MAKQISSFLELNLSDDEIAELIADKQLGTIDSPIQQPVTDHAEYSGQPADDAHKKTSIKIEKFHGVLGDWVNYFSPNQARKMDDMIERKFESIHLNLVFDANMATKRIKKYGRILENKNSICNGTVLTDQPKSTTMNFENHRSTRSPSREKPVLTPEEAVSIRRKDRVVIMDEHLTKSTKNDDRSCLCCGFCWCWITRMTRSCIACCPGQRAINDKYQSL